MSKADDINRELEKISQRIMDAVNKESDYAINLIDGMRKDITDILMEYADTNDVIPESRIRSLLNELNDIETGMGDSLYEALNDSVDKVARDTEKNLTGVLIATLGVAIVFGGRDKRPERDDIISEVADFINSREIKGVPLSKRIKAVSGILRDEMQRAIRYGVTMGESVTKISRRIKKAFDKAVWQVKRVFTTELPNAFRKTVATIGSKAGIVKGVKIIDNRGRHKYHEKHECYRLAEQDKYGMGKGVYKPSDTFIYSPHPQCSAYFRLVFYDNMMEGGSQ